MIREGILKKIFNGLADWTMMGRRGRGKKSKERSTKNERGGANARRDDDDDDTDKSFQASIVPSCSLRGTHSQISQHVTS